MPVDALLKKYFAVVLLTLVAAMAFFQASGVMKLLGAALGADEKALAQAPKAPAGRTLAARTEGDLPCPSETCAAAGR